MMRTSFAAVLLVVAAAASAQTAPTATAASAASAPAAPPARSAAATTYSSIKPAPTDTSLPRQKLVTVFGTDPCPKSNDPNEIIVCTRRSDNERDRIPRDLRDDRKPVGAFEGTNRSALLGDPSGGAGGGIGSCSAVGPGGGTGCNQAIQNQYRAARKAGEVPQAILPEITPNAPASVPPF